MQNVVIIGALVVVLVGGVLYFTSSSDTKAPTDMASEDSMMEDDQMDAAMEEATMATEADIVTTAINTPALSTLVTALTAAELVTILQGAGPFTVFAPTNDAFAALPAGTVETLLAPANQAQLQGILTYHVVSGEILAADLEDGMTLQTVNGEIITIGVTDAGVTINDGAAVVMADVMTSNGVVHVIDSVLLPSAQ